jgi:integral membrane protein (TIGR01906 family)
MNRAYRLLSWVITLSIPFVLLMTAVRIMLTPLFLEIEYRTPGFPPDPYGFTMQERLKWSRISVDYLTNREGISFLENHRLSETTPLYNPDELSHMVDVKNLVQEMLVTWAICVLVLVGLGLWAWKGSWLVDFWLGVSQGGWLTLILIFTLLIAVFTGFDTLFTAFHRLFFVGNTWIFAYSDSLIRLFPIRFWQDAFILVGVLTIIGAIALIITGRKYSRV